MGILSSPHWRRRGAIAVALAITAVAFALSSALTSSNTVPGTNWVIEQDDPTLLDIAPAECSALVVTTLLKATGGVNGGNADELILGGPAAQTLKGKNGDDCIVGGAGNDTLDGGNNNDVCLGQGGTDSFSNCEVQIQ
jgi:Ca2+-binding RTX toxin-like protein